MPEIPDAAFLKLETPSYSFAETTPEVPDEFRGFKLAGPRRMLAGGALRIPVSAVARFGDESSQLPSPLWDSVSAIVVEVGHNRCWVGTLMDANKVPTARPTAAEADSGAGEGAGAGAPAAPAAPAERSEDDEIPEAAATGVATQCAHVDLRELLELPGTPGTYEISLTYGPWASNAVRVVVEKPREGE